MDLKSRHFKSIDLKSKSKSKSKYPNATFRSCDYFGERKERDVDRKINVILERERKEMLYF
jgi:hypothetical protein